MFEVDQDRLERLGAAITTREIQQQPDLWKQAFDNYLEHRIEIKGYLMQIAAKHAKVRVIFTGAGTSAYVGDTITPYLNQVNATDQWEFESIATTDLVAAPYAYFKAEVPTLLVSFARSGNSPESVAAVALAKQCVDELYQLTITCAPDGKLALQAAGDERNLVLLQPAKSNDAGFAMTGSFTCMTLTALLVFDTADFHSKQTWMRRMVRMGESVIERVADLQELVDLDFDRVVYLGSGPFFGLAHEVQLKILELTAGQIATLYESPMGFRHGPKSFVNEKTLIISFVSNQAYTAQYDQDILLELVTDQIARKVFAIQIEGATNIADVSYFEFESDEVNEAIPDAYLALPNVMVGQTIALLTSLKCGVTPDTPSASGTVNRVVKGVTIHPYQVPAK